MQIHAELEPRRAARQTMFQQHAAPALTRAETAELAAQFIAAQDQAERDHVLAAALIHAAAKAGGSLAAPTGRRLGAMLLTLAPSPEITKARRAKTRIELEHSSNDDRALAEARRFIRLAAAAAAHAQSGPLGAARAAFVATTGAPPPLTSPRFEYDPEMEYFLGGLIRSAGRAVRDVGRAVDKAATVVGKIPVLGDVARAGVGAARLGLGSTAIALDVGSRLARGQKLGTALKGAVVGQIDAVRSQLKLAEMVAPFVPGIGQGVAAALGAANALAAGRPITEALLASARAALPGGAIAQAAFDTAINLAQGKNIGEAALATVRERLPGGAAAKTAFDGAVALGQGKKLQDVAFAAAGRVLPASPYAADALDFVKRVSRGQNVQHAALSIAGKRALGQARGQARKASQRETEYEFAWVPPPAELAKLKAAAIALWRTGGGNTLVKVMPKGVPPAPGRMAGYATTIKYLRGRTPAQMERDLGLRAGSKLARGAAIFVVRPLPTAAQFDLSSYSQMPAGVATNDPSYAGHPDYPPGRGAPQWNLSRFPQSGLHLLATVEPGERFIPPGP